jgi:urease accessory protein
MRPGKPWVFANLKEGQGVAEVIDFIVSEGMLDKKRDKAV